MLEGLRRFIKGSNTEERQPLIAPEAPVRLQPNYLEKFMDGLIERGYKELPQLPIRLYEGNTLINNISVNDLEGNKIVRGFGMYKGEGISENLVDFVAFCVKVESTKKAQVQNDPQLDVYFLMATYCQDKPILLFVVNNCALKIHYPLDSNDAVENRDNCATIIKELIEGKSLYKHICDEYNELGIDNTLSFTLTDPSEFKSKNSRRNIA